MDTVHSAIILEIYFEEVSAIIEEVRS